MRKIEINKSKLHGHGLFSTCKILKGQHVDYIHGPIVVFREFSPAISKRMLNWVGVGRYSWIDTTNSLFRFINHSCKPNVALITRRKVIALEDIQVGCEITMDYSLTEAEPGWSIDECSCGHNGCRNYIGPISTLPLKIYQKYLPNITARFRKVYVNDSKNTKLSVMHKKG